MHLEMNKHFCYPAGNVKRKKEDLRRWKISMTHRHPEDARRERIRSISNKEESSDVTNQGTGKVEAWIIFAVLVTQIQ